MKHLRRIGVTLALVLVFANVTSADEGIMLPGYVPPSPPPSAGIMYTGLADNRTQMASEAQTDDLATELMLSLIQNLLVLF